MTALHKDPTGSYYALSLLLHGKRPLVAWLITTARSLHYLLAYLTVKEVVYIVNGLKNRTGCMKVKVAVEVQQTKGIKSKHDC